MSDNSLFAIAQSRRRFLGQLAAAPFFVPRLLSAPPSGTLRLASFGAGGMAWATLDGIATHARVKLICAADVDSTRLERVKKKYPDARIYEDWREMLKREKKNLDAACVGTPDHMHAPIAMPRCSWAGMSTCRSRSRMTSMKRAS